MNRRPLLRLVPLALAIALISGCFPADPGFGVRVENQCTVPIRFGVAGGSTRQVDSEEPMAAAASETYSVLAFEDEGGFVSLVEPSEQTVTFAHPREGFVASVVASGPDCRLRVGDEVAMPETDS